MPNLNQLAKYESLYMTVWHIITHCKEERESTGCAECVFLQFCETIANGEIVPLSTIAESMMLIEISERLAAERRTNKTWAELRRDKE